MKNLKISLLNIICFFSITITKLTFAKNNEEQTTSKSHTTKSELDKAFISAISNSDLKEMEKLIKAGADINVSIPHTETSGDCDWQVESSPLIFAIKTNKPEMVKILLQAKNKLNISLNQALNEAITEGRPTIVEELIKSGADINSIDTQDKNSPLILAIKCARPLSEFNKQAQARMISRWEARKKIIQILLKAGVNINHANKHGNTALMEAIKQYDLNTVQDLLKFPEIATGSFFGFGKKPINMANENGDTALIIAINHIETSFVSGDTQRFNLCKNSWKILNALLNFPGIDPHHINKKGETAITLLKKLEEKTKLMSDHNTIYV